VCSSDLLLVLFPKLFRSLLAKETIYTTIPCGRVFQVFIDKLIKTIFTDVNSPVFQIITASKSKRDMNVVNTFPIFAVTCVFIAHLRINFNGFTTTITAYFIQNIFLTNYCFNTEFFHKRSPLLM